jgi:hypothetical protein
MVHHWLDVEAWGHLFCDGVENLLRACQHFPEVDRDREPPLQECVLSPETACDVLLQRGGEEILSNG